MRPSSLRLSRSRSSSIMSVPEDAALESPCGTPPLPSASLLTPPYTLSAFNISSNPRAKLLRRSSSVSTMGSIDDEEDQCYEWTDSEIESLRQIYDQCVQEASFDTPFSGAPPSQLLHTIARACRRVHRDSWRHSIQQTRLKALSLAKETIAQMDREDSMIQATPKLANGQDMDTTPRHRRLRRNDSMDFLPDTRSLAALAKLSDRLNSTREDPLTYRHSSRNRTETVSTGSSASVLHGPAPGRLARSMTFSNDSVNGASEDEMCSTASSSFATFHPRHATTANSSMDHANRFDKPILRTASGFVPISKNHYFSRPSLYDTPTFAGAIGSPPYSETLTTLESSASIYGSSISSNMSYLSSSSASTLPPSVTGKREASDGREEELHTRMVKQRVYDSGYGSDSNTNVDLSVGSLSGTDWSGSTISLASTNLRSTLVNEAGSQHPGLTYKTSTDNFSTFTSSSSNFGGGETEIETDMEDDDSSGIVLDETPFAVPGRQRRDTHKLDEVTAGILDPRYVSAGLSESTIVPTAPSRWLYLDRQPLASTDTASTGLESPFDGAFIKKL